MPVGPRATGLSSLPSLGSATTIVAMATLLLVPGIVAGAGASGRTVHHPSIVATSRIGEKEFNTTFGVYFLASVGTVALAIAATSPFGYEEILYSAPSNASIVVSPRLTNGSTPVALVAAGGDFVAEWQNSSTARYWFETITPVGTAKHIVPPLNSLRQWALPYGNLTTLVAFSPGRLLLLDATTFAVTANLSSLVPPTVYVDTAAPSGSLLYVAGDEHYSCCGYQPYAAWINTSSSKSVTLVGKTAPFGANVSGGFYGVAVRPGQVDFAGAQIFSRSNLTSYQENTVRGFLYEYSLSTGLVTNVSALLPRHGLGAFGLTSIGPAAVLTLAAFNLSFGGPISTYTQFGALYLLHGAGTSLSNETRLTGTSYVAEFEETSASGGWFFTGGSDLVTGDAEIIAIPVADF